MDNFPSNSREPRPKQDTPEKKPVTRVVQGNVVRRKKPLGNRIQEMFFGGDNQGVFNYVIGDVLVPAWRDMVADAVTQGIERMVYGESHRPATRRANSRPGTFSGTSNHVNYSRYSKRDEPRPQNISRQARARHDFDEIIIDSRGEAEEVIDQLYTILEKYEMVSVRDLYELVGVVFHPTDEKWGWTDLRGSSVRRVSGGYLLDLPKTEALD